MTNQLAIPIHFVRASHVWHVKQDLGRRCRTLHEIEMPAIPGKARVAVVPLVSPWPVDAQILPAVVIRCWRGPGWIISHMKLPLSIERNCASAQSFNHQGRPGERLCGM